MISIDLGTLESYDSQSQEFKYDVGGVVRFEYSLKAVYDWEAKWLKPFLKGGLTEQESFDFYMMMALDPIDERFMTISVIQQLADYIDSSNTATTFSSYDNGQNGNKNPNPGKNHTAEELYAMMFTAQIPLEFENRNLNRLLTILKILSAQNSPPKKMNKQDILKQNAELNRKRKEQMKTKG